MIGTTKRTSRNPDAQDKRVVFTSPEKSDRPHGCRRWAELLVLIWLFTPTPALAQTPATATLAAPTGLTEANLTGSAITVTVTVANTAYEDPLTAAHFMLSDTVPGVVSISGGDSGVARDSPTQATLTLTHDGTDITMAGALTVTVQDAGHAGTGNLTTATVPITAGAGMNICGRTAQVRDDILAHISSAATCGDVAASDLAGITSLLLSNEGISTLQNGDFAGLSALTRLSLSNNSLSTLPENVFNGLSALEELVLFRNSLNTLPENVFNGLSALEELDLSLNNLSTLPDNVFNGLSALETLELDFNSLNTLPDNVFNGLSALEDLDLNGNTFTPGTGLPAGVFDDVLDTLGSIGARFSSASFIVDANVRDAHFVCSLPDAMLVVDATAGVDDCLLISSEQLTAFAMTDTTLSALTISAVALIPAFDPTIDAYTVAVQNSVANISITPTANQPTATITVQDMAVTSGSVTLPLTVGTPLDIAIEVTAPDGTTMATYTVTVSRPASGGATAALSGTITEANLSAGTAMATMTLTGTEFVAAADLMPNDFAISDAIDGDVSITGVTLGSSTTATLMLEYSGEDITANGNLFITLLAAGHTGTGDLAAGSLPIIAGAGMNICGRTAQVRDTILANISPAATCGDVAAADLAGITRLFLGSRGISALQNGDFAGLSALEDLELDRNSLRTLPDNVFNGLSALEDLDLGNNSLITFTLPENVFNGLSALRFLDLQANSLSTLPDNVFNGLSALEELRLFNTSLSTLPDNVFNGLSALTSLELGLNRLSTLPENVFNGLSALTRLGLDRNNLSTLPENVFNGLSALEELDLDDNNLSTLPANVFNGLSALEDLDLDGNNLSTLPENVFNGLSALTRLELHGNNLSTLPENVFNGLSALTRLSLRDNNISTLPANVFNGLAALTVLTLNGNMFTADTGLPAGVFDDVLDTLSVFFAGFDDTVRAAHFVCSLPEAMLVVDATAGVDDCLRITSAQLAAFAMTDTTLSALTISAGILMPAFDPTIDEYTVAVQNNVASIMVTPTANRPAATIFVQDVAVTSGMASTALALVEGDSLFIEISVTAPDGTTTQSFTLIVSGGATAALSGTITEADLFAGTAMATLTLTGIEFVADLMPNDFTISDTIDGDVSITGVTLGSSTTATLMLEHSGEDITANGNLFITLLAAGHTGTGDLPAGTVPVTAGAGMNICGRTAQVRDAILADISSTATSTATCGDVAASDLAGITQLFLESRGISALQNGDFAGLSALEDLALFGNSLSTLPVNVFNGLSALTILELDGNNISTLLANVFNGLSALEDLALDENNLSELPAGIFSGLTALEVLYLDENNLATLPDGVFSGLSNLELLELDDNALTSLDADVFSGLSALVELRLFNNRLTSLNTNVFDGLDALEDLWLFGNPFIADTGLPAGVFDDVLNTLGDVESDVTSLTPGDLTNGGGVMDGNTSGRFFIDDAVRDAHFVCARSDADAIVAATTGVSDCLRITSAQLTTALATPPTATLAASPPLTEGNLTGPTTTVTVTVANTEYEDPLTAAHFMLSDTVPGVVSISGGDSGVARDSPTQATLTLTHDGTDITMAGALMVTVQDAGHAGTGNLTTGTVPITAGAGMNICGRTAQVRDAILADISSTATCGDVAASDLAGITGLGLSGSGISTLQNGDFAGLSALDDLLLHDNNLSTLPDNVFNGLSALEDLALDENNLSGLPDGIFSGLTALEILYLDENNLATLPDGVFSGLSNLAVLELDDNALTSLDADVFSGLSALVELRLFNNRLTSLNTNVFDGLNALEDLWLFGNPFIADTGLPAGVFDDVLNTLGDVESDVTSLTPDDLRDGGDVVIDGISGSFFIDDTVRNAHFVCARSDADAVVTATTGVSDCIRITSEQLAAFETALAGVTVSQAALIVPEDGSSTADYTLVLATAPTADVTIAVASSDTLAATVSSASLTFTPANWNTAQTVTVTGVNDDAPGDRIATVTHAPTSTDTTYNSVSIDSVTVTVEDDDTAGLTFDPASVSVNEGGSDSYTVVLDTQPTVTVTVAITAGGDVSTNPASLAFTTSNWNTAQTVTVNASQDVDGNNDSQTLAHAASGAEYDSVTGDVSVTVIDDDVPGVRISTTTLTVPEGGPNTYTVRLNTQPTGDVMVTVNGASGDVSVTGSPLTFTTINWDTDQTVTVNAAQDDDAAPDATVTLTHGVTGYGAINSGPEVVVTVTEDDTAGLTFDPVSVSVNEGGSSSYTVVLDTEPTVTVTVAITAGGDVSTNPASLTFTTSNWNTAQTVTVNAAEDSDGNNDSQTLAHAASGAEYDSVTGDVSVTVIDDDVPGVRISPTALTVPEGGPNTYTVRLNTQPTGDVVVTVNGASGDVTFSGSPLTFTTGNWDTDQTVTVNAAQDDDAAPDATVTLTHGVTGYGAIASGPDVVVTITEDDTARVTVSPTTLTVFEKGGTADYTVVLTTQPTGDVTITPVSGDTSVATVSAALTFTTTDWNTPQTVTVTGMDDGIDNPSDRTATVTHTIAGGGYGSVPVADVAVTAIDANQTLVGFGYNPDEVVLNAPTPPTVMPPSGAQTPLTYSSATSAVCTVDTDTGALMLLAVGDCIITVTASATTNFNEETVDFTVMVLPMVTLDPVADNDIVNIAEHMAGFDISGMVTAGAAVSVTLGSSSSRTATVTDTNWTLLIPPSDAEITGASVAVLVTATANGNTGTVERVIGVDLVAPTLESAVVNGDTLTLLYDMPLDEGSVPSSNTYTVDVMTPGTPPTDQVHPVNTVSISGMSVTLMLFTAVTANDEVTLDYRPPGADPVQDVGGNDAAMLDDEPVTNSTFSGPTQEEAEQLQEALTSQVVQAAAAQVIASVGARIETALSGGGLPPTGGARLDGQNIAGDGEAVLLGFLQKAPEYTRSLKDGTLDWKRMLANSSFILNVNDENGTGGNLGLWGSGYYTDFDGDDNNLNWDGNSYGFQIGADTQLNPNLLTGVAASWSRGDVEYNQGRGTDEQEGDYTLTLTGIHPYIGWSDDEAIWNLWANAGYAEGEVEIKPDEGRKQEHDISMISIAGGFKRALTDLFYINADFSIIETDVDASDDTNNDQSLTIGSQRFRLLLEAQSQRQLDEGGIFIRSGELGYRLDEGDSDANTNGAELGGSINYSNLSTGLTLSGEARALVGNSDYQEWGISGLIRLQTGAQGLSFTLEPGYGDTAGGASELWNRRTPHQPTERNDYGARMKMYLGYGLNGFVTPYTEMTTGNDRSRYRMGVKWQLGESLGLDLFGEQHQGADTENALRLEGELRF